MQYTGSCYCKALAIGVKERRRKKNGEQQTEVGNENRTGEMNYIKEEI